MRNTGSGLIQNVQSYTGYAKNVFDMKSSDMEFMKVSCTKNRIRILTGIMAIMMLFVVLLSSFYIASHVDHDCTGEDCPVCAFLQQCENSIRGMGNGINAVIAVILPAIIYLIFISSGISSFEWDTPVSRKVRLNN